MITLVIWYPFCWMAEALSLRLMRMMKMVVTAVMYVFKSFLVVLGRSLGMTLTER